MNTKMDCGSESADIWYSKINNCVESANIRDLAVMCHYGISYVIILGMCI